MEKAFEVPPVQETTTRNRAKAQQVHDHLPSSYPRSSALAGLIMLLVFIGGCGGGSSSFNPNNVSVTVSPATATVSAGGTVTLTATENGNCSGCMNLINLWSVVENGSTDCGWAGADPPAGPCPGGTTSPNAGANTLMVTYYAPSAPGTYHVTAEVDISLANYSGVVKKDGTSVITVTP
jgi:hypothetical protein